MLISREYNYLHGDCWLFALELKRYTGWEIVETWDCPPGIGHHVFCRTPDGRQVDATGWCDYLGVEPWNNKYTDAAYWAGRYGAIFPATLDYLSFDVETLLFKLGISYVTPRGSSVLLQLGIKS